MGLSALPKHLKQPLTTQTNLTQLSNKPYNTPKTTTPRHHSPLSQGSWTAKEDRAYDTQVELEKTVGALRGLQLGEGADA